MKPGRELSAFNRRIVAERLDWPGGAVEACEKIDTDYPAWHADYRHQWETNPAGYYALHEHHYFLEPHLYGGTAEELREKISRHRCRTDL